jgi:hypothetical protein
MKILLLTACLLSIILLVSCGVSSFLIENQPHIRIADKLTYAFISDMKKKGYWVEMTGGGMMDGVVDQIDVGFAIVGKPTVEEARLQYVAIAEAFLSKINHNAEIRPYLIEYPATIKVFDLHLSFRKTNTSTAPVEGKEVVAYMFTSKGITYYSYYDSTCALKFQDLHEEPYEEALRIVREQYPELLPSP